MLLECGDAGAEQKQWLSSGEGREVDARMGPALDPAVQTQASERWGNWAEGVSAPGQLFSTAQGG